LFAAEEGDGSMATDETGDERESFGEMVSQRLSEKPFKAL